MVKKRKTKRKPRSKLNYQTVWLKIKALFQTIWQQTIIYNVVLFILSGILIYLIVNFMFSNYFNCRFLITESLGIPDFMCEGKDLKIFNIPGLRSVMDPPLEWIRLSILWMILIFFVVISGVATYIINNLKWVIKLFTFDKKVWQELLLNLKIFITIFAFLCLVFLLV